MEYRWGLWLILLAACDPVPKNPGQQAPEPEMMRFDTEQIRHEVDVYKTKPSALGKRRMEKAFAAFDSRVGELEAEARSLADSAEREAMERRIANLKMRRELHWTRSQTVFADSEPVKRAEPVAERSEAVKPRSKHSAPKVMKAEPVQVMRAEPAGDR